MTNDKKCLSRAKKTQLCKMFNELRQEIYKQIKELMNKIFGKLKDDTNNMLIVLNKTIQDSNKHLGKELRIMR